MASLPKGWINKGALKQLAVEMAVLESAKERSISKADSHSKLRTLSHNALALSWYEGCYRIMCKMFNFSMS